MTTDSRNESLFSACLLFRSIHNDQPSEADVWEESVILLRADDESSALERAANIGRGRSLSYTVEEGDVVSLQFVLVERVYKIEDSVMNEGAEVFSRHLRGSEVKSLLEPFSQS